MARKAEPPPSALSGTVATHQQAELGSPVPYGAWTRLTPQPKPAKCPSGAAAESASTLAATAPVSSIMAPSAGVGARYDKQHHSHQLQGHHRHRRVGGGRSSTRTLLPATSSSPMLDAGGAVSPATLRSVHPSSSAPDSATGYSLCNSGAVGYGASAAASLAPAGSLGSLNTSGGGCLSVAPAATAAQAHAQAQAQATAHAHAQAQAQVHAQAQAQMVAQMQAVCARNDVQAPPRMGLGPAGHVAQHANGLPMQGLGLASGDSSVGVVMDNHTSLEAARRPEMGASTQGKLARCASTSPVFAVGLACTGC